MKGRGVRREQRKETKEDEKHESEKRNRTIAIKVV